MIGYLMTFLLFLVGMVTSAFIATMQWLTGTSAQPTFDR
jgi:hypothetical protein